MKKTIIVMLALFLALPAISFAGSATSRWDMTIGGYVKFDMGYNTQGAAHDIVQAQRTGTNGYESIGNQYNSFFMYSGQTALNFLVRGPDAWGAKTSAFVEGHFRGNEYTNAGSNSATGVSSSTAGTFGLRHAFMQFDWPSSKLVIGQTWQTWGILPTFANTLLDYNNLGPFLKGMRQPLVRFEQTLAKSWTWKLGVIAPTNTLGSNWAGSSSTGVVDSYTRSQMPFFEGSFGWSSDKCGKVGPWQMMFALEGFFGRQKQIAAVTGTTVSGSATTFSTTFTDKDVNSWGISLKGFIPIVPEKKGNKAGAFTLSGMLFYTQNPGMFQSPTTSGNNFASNYSYSGGSYVGSTGNVLTLTEAQMQALDYSSPTQYGGWGQISYFFTDKLFVNGWYGYTKSNVSDAWRLAGMATSATGNSTNYDAMVNTSQIIANIMYDVNAAIRFGFEYSYYTTTYANYLMNGNTIVGSKDGSAHSFRVGAYYFF
jgi:hypothetical protein